MEFWGVEVKAGQPLKVTPEDGMVLHLSQASIGESKKGSQSALLNLKVGDKKFVIGTLSHEKFPQISFDLVFDEEFELSHSWKNGSVYFVGYKSVIPEEDDFSDDFDSDEEEPALIPLGTENGKVEEKSGKAVAKGSAGKPEPAVKKAEPSKDDDDESDEDDESDDSEGIEDESDTDEEMQDGESDEDSDEDDEEDDEETTKKVDTGKKRPAESEVKTPASKKAKSVPGKTDGKKGGHSATPHPAKQGGKTPQPQTPKSGGKVSCSSCKKSFSSDVGLQSHNKDKHGGK